MDVYIGPAQTLVADKAIVTFWEGAPVRCDVRVHHTRAGRFGRFGETEIAEAARELALAFAENARPG
jgi:hypothetical protein